MMAEENPVSAAVVQQPAPEHSQGAAGANAPPEFFIDLRPRLFKLPEFKNKTTINVRYPLLPPYAFANIYWDVQQKELLYYVEESKMSDAEEELLRLIQLGLEEMINISFSYATKSN